GLRRPRRVVVANDDVLDLHTGFMRGNLRQDRKDTLADLGHAGHDLGAAAIIDLSPGGGAIDHRGTRYAVPAGRHASSAFPCHYSAASCFSLRAKRAPRAQGGRISVRLRSLRVPPREAGAPASQPDAFS